MFRPLSDDEKKQYLSDAMRDAVLEAKRRESELAELRKTAQTLFAALLPKFSPQLEVVQAEMPSQKPAPPFEELWSVKPKVTFEK